MNSKLWIAPLALAAVVACRNLLNEEPQSFVTSDSFFQTEADLKSGVIAAYSPMRSGNLFNGWPWLSLELASDQVRIDHDEPNLETSGPDFLFYSTGSRGVTVAWRELYNMIFRANLVLANADRVQQWTNPALKPTYLSESKFLRGYAYLWLTKLYDDVPLLLTLADHANLDVPRTPVEQVHQQIIKDLTEAEAVLPAKWGSSDRGRATRGAAEMALADLYLWRASFLKRTAEWQKASDWAKKLIDSGDWGLSADYISTFLPSNKGNREMIFYVPGSGVDSRSSTGGFVNFYFPRDFGLSTGGGWGAGQHVNRTRARARSGTGAQNRPSPADYAGPLDQLAVRDAIYAERDLELAHEAKRWFDLVRRDSEEPLDSLGRGYWATSLRAHDPNSYAKGDIADYKKRWPVPQGEIDLDPKLLPNNAGY